MYCIRVPKAENRGLNSVAGTLRPERRSHTEPLWNVRANIFPRGHNVEEQATFGVELVQLHNKETGNTKPKLLCHKVTRTETRFPLAHEHGYGKL